MSGNIFYMSLRQYLQRIIVKPTSHHKDVLRSASYNKGNKNNNKKRDFKRLHNNYNNRETEENLRGRERFKIIIEELSQEQKIHRKIVKPLVYKNYF